MSLGSHFGAGGGPAHQDLPGSLWGQLEHDYPEPVEKYTDFRNKLLQHGGTHYWSLGLTSFLKVVASLDSFITSQEL